MDVVGNSDRPIALAPPLTALLTLSVSSSERDQISGHICQLSLPTPARLLFPSLPSSLPLPVHLAVVVVFVVDIAFAQFLHSL